MPVDPSWPEQARRIVARLNTACGHRAIRIDHSGSTAVPGLDAKDVIDIQVTVDSLATADELSETLLTAGYPRIAAITGDVAKPDARSTVTAFDHTDIQRSGTAISRLGRPGRPTNVHLRVDGWPNQQFPLLFTDWLIANPGVQADYLAAKRAAARGARASRHRGVCRREGTVVPRRVPAGVGVGVCDELGAFLGPMVRLRRPMIRLRRPAPRARPVRERGQSPDWC